MAEETNVKVMVRVRPFNGRETNLSLSAGQELRSCVLMRDNVCSVLHDDGTEREASSFDECFWSLPAEQEYSEKPFADQAYVYQRSGLPLMYAALAGYNTCIFAYGQTGSGKTHSMLGTRDDPGISPRLVDDLFLEIEKIQGASTACKVTVECTFMEVYNEKVRNLLQTSNNGEVDDKIVKIRQHPQKGVFVEGLNRIIVTTAEQTKAMIEKGTNERAVAETKMNARSSRSHAIFQMHIAQNDRVRGIQRHSNINLVDLAGSEKIKMSGATGDTLTEAKNINLSLSTLRKVIDVLIENQQQSPRKGSMRVPPFRESVLTWVLSDSLAGNSKTMMMATVSPHITNVEDTLGTLRYAQRARAIVCQVRVNEERSAVIVQSMKDEIQRLQSALSNREHDESLAKELQMRQEELGQMTAEHAKLNERVEQLQQREVEFKKEMEIHRSETLKYQAEHNMRKMERFAEAFRNAFLIKKTAVEIHNQHRMLEEFEWGMKFLREENEVLKSEVAHLKKTAEESVSGYRRHVEKLTTKAEETDTLCVDVGVQLKRAQERIRSLESLLMVAEVQKTDRERQVHRLEKEVACLSSERLQWSTNMIKSEAIIHRLEQEKKQIEDRVKEAEARAWLANDQLERQKRLSGKRSSSPSIQ